VPPNHDGLKAVYTTGEVAGICQISQQTVIRCFDSGRLRGYRVPGSRFRKIPHESLVDFMRENGIPMDRLESGMKRVLIVDDDDAIVSMFEELLARDGRFDLKTALCGFDAGMLCKEFRPDLMILDYKLPDINGNVVCSRVRANPELARMKIILVSGVADPDEVDELKHAGADEFIKKPFDIEAIIHRMAELLEIPARVPLLQKA